MKLLAINFVILNDFPCHLFWQEIILKIQQFFKTILFIQELECRNSKNL